MGHRLNKWCQRKLRIKYYKDAFFNLRSLIIGCGYLGGALARYWREKGYFVIGTTTRQERLAEVAALASEAALLDVSDEEQLKGLLARVQVAVVLVAASGPQLEDYKRAYLETAHAVSRALIYAPSLRQVVYTSSTAVYGDHEGRRVDEKTPLEPLTEQAEVLRETEEVYLHGFEACTSTLLRLGELHGPGRSMKARVTRLCSTVLAGSGSAPVNLTHQEDAVRAIDWVIERRLGGIYNVVSAAHPTRRELYRQICEELGLEQVAWDEGPSLRHLGEKQVSSAKLEATGFKFFSL